MFRYGRFIYVLAMVTALLPPALSSADAMTFTWRSRGSVFAEGPIEEGDAAKFAALPRFETLELDSPGGLVSEALAIAANIDLRGDIRTVVKPGASCASACAMALFVSGRTRVVNVGGRIGIHSCAKAGGSPVPECNKAMAANATAHGVPWGVIEGFGNHTKPSNMIWLNAEDAECWGLMKWNAQDTSNNGIACWQRGTAIRPADVTLSNANDLLCRSNAGTSRTFVATGQEGQGFSVAYRTACKRIAADPRTPKYAAIDIIMWLTLTDPQILDFKPGTTIVNILDRDAIQIGNCWKCLTIIGISELMNGHPTDALAHLREAVSVVNRDTGSAPTWLSSRVDIAAAEAEAQKKRH